MEQVRLKFIPGDKQQVYSIPRRDVLWNSQSVREVYAEGINWTCQLIEVSIIELQSLTKSRLLIDKRPAAANLTIDLDPASDKLIIRAMIWPAYSEPFNLIIKEIPHGRHRATNQAPHGNSPQGPSPTAPGAAVPNNPASQAPASGPGQNTFAVNLASLSKAPALWTVMDLTSSQALPHVNTFGELLAWRVWRLTPQGELQSGYTNHVWVPGLPIHGDVEAGHGVYGFKDRGKKLQDAVTEYRVKAALQASPGAPVAIGTIELWGEVIECQYGYRGEWARVANVVALAGAPVADQPRMLRELQAAYCPKQGEEK